MFTGLIRAQGTVVAASAGRQGRRIVVDVSGLPSLPAPGASVAVSGVCLTVTAVDSGRAAFDAVAETVSRSTLGGLEAGARVNLEPALCAGDPLDGHIVLGHVDATSRIIGISAQGEARVFVFSLPAEIRPLVAAKGSIAIDGISLTVVNAGRDDFSVSLIPHTLASTTLGAARPGDIVNLEADVLARYAARQREVRSGLDLDFLREHGFA